MQTVTLSLDFRTRMDGQEETSFQEVPGTMDTEIGGYCLQYAEIAESDATRVTIRTDGRRAVIDRRGTRSAKFILEPGVPHPCDYETAVGTLTMTVKNADVASALTEDGGTLRLRYTLEMGGGDSEHEINITVRKD